jgi:hypothetical protein
MEVIKRKASSLLFKMQGFLRKYVRITQFKKLFFTLYNTKDLEVTIVLLICGVFQFIGGLCIDPVLIQSRKNLIQRKSFLGADHFESFFPKPVLSMVVEVAGFTPPAFMVSKSVLDGIPFSSAISPRVCFDYSPRRHWI